MNIMDDESIDAAVRAVGHAEESAHLSADAIDSYVDGYPSEEEREGVEQHLLWCRSCADSVADRQMLSHRVEPEECLPMPVDDAWKDLQARLGTPQEMSPQPKSWRNWIAVAASFFFAIGWGVTLFQQRSDSPQMRALARPQFGFVLNDSVVPGGTRGSEQERTVFTFENENDLVGSVLTPGELVVEGEFVGRISRADGTVVFGPERIPVTQFGTFTLSLFGRSLPSGRYVIEIERVDQATVTITRFPIEIVKSYEDESG